MDKCGKPSNAINDEYDVVSIATSIVNPGVVDGENVINTGGKPSLLMMNMMSLALPQELLTWGLLVEKM